MNLQKAEKDELDVSLEIEDYHGSQAGFIPFLRDVADEVFVFDGYREYQDEILYEAVEELYLNGTQNIIIGGPTGIGKSPVNVAIARVGTYLNEQSLPIQQHFGVSLDLDEGNGFYCTPQKQLRNQLAEDDDLQEYVDMLKSRSDYICGETGSPCNDCPVLSDPDSSCMQESACTYWDAKMDAIESNAAVLTFAMLVVDDNIPKSVETEHGEERVGFGNRDVVIVDEGHGIENQAASLFAGFTVSPFSLPNRVFADAGDNVSWDAERIEDVSGQLIGIANRAEKYITENEHNDNLTREVRQCENFLTKYQYMNTEITEDRPWVVNIEQVQIPGDSETTKKIELKPVQVDRFLNRFVWNRGNKRVISSATIPWRGSIDKFANRIGLNGSTKMISKPSPFPREHQLIHTNTEIGEMSGDSEDENWFAACRKVEEIQSHHEGENGLIHTNSYERAERLQESIGDELVMVHDRELDASVQIRKWQESEQPILASPAMTEGVDLYDDRCRWQAILKVPFGMIGDSRVNYLLNEKHQWGWYYETTSNHLQQAAGRAVRGPDDAASMYILDSKFDEVMNRTSPPEWFLNTITDEKPDHWDNPEAAPWR
jgi:Rad3-related DNA helicase